MLIAVTTMLLGLVVILVIIAANGYFVAQEFAYMSVDRNRLAAQAEEGDQAAQRALKITRRTSFMLSGAQLGITVSGLMVGYVAEPLVGNSLGTLLGGVGVPAGVSISVGTILALGLSTLIQMIFGELYPKNLAIANPGPLARALARSTNIYLTIFGWLITIFDHAANGLLRLVGIKPVEDLDSSATASDLRHIVADSRHSGHLDDDLSIMLDRILDFRERDIGHAMVTRSKTDVVPSDATISEVRKKMATAHSRYPVLDDQNTPVGIVHIMDVLAAPATSDEPVSTIMRDPVRLPTVVTLPQALARMFEADAEFACVIDEYGGLAGIVTREDLAEEISGDSTDEHDAKTAEPVTTHDTGVWRIAGQVPLDEAEREIGQQLPRGDYETISGMVIAYQRDLPAVGTSVRIPLPQTADDLIGEEPITRYLDAKVLELGRHVPEVVELSVDTNTEDATGTKEDA